MEPAKYVRSDSSNKSMGMDYVQSKNFGDDRDEALQKEVGVRKAYVMQPAGERHPEITLESAMLPNSREGTFNPTTAERVRNRTESDFMGFSTSVENQRQKFINVNEFQKTPGAVTTDQAGYGYPNFSADEKRESSNRTTTSYGNK